MLITLALTACAVRPAGPPDTLPARSTGHPDTTPASEARPTLPPARIGQAVAVAPGVYLVQGAPGEYEPANRGWVGNAGFIVGPRGVVMVDSGTSARQGEALLAEVARVSPLPIRAVVLTQTRQEFLFGVTVFQQRGIPAWMSRPAAQLMAARCATCLKNLTRVLGEVEMVGTKVPVADRVFDGGQDIGELIGRPVRLLEFGHSSGPGHVAVLDVSSGSLFAGGLLDQGRIPDVQDARLEGWQAALAQLQTAADRGEIRRVVPGHGPAASPALIRTVGRYLADLDALSLRLLKQGTPLSEVGDACELPEFDGWDQYDTIHRRNASVLFLKHEREELLAPASGSPNSLKSD